MAIPANLELGVGKTLGPRDPERAMNNHFEALILFTIAVVVISLGDKNTGFTAICAWIYFGARVLYIPAYYFGLTPWRSLIWFTGFLATLFMLLSVLI